MVLLEGLQSTCRLLEFFLGSHYDILDFESHINGDVNLMVVLLG